MSVKRSQPLLSTCSFPVCELITSDSILSNLWSYVWFLCLIKYQTVSACARGEVCLRDFLSWAPVGKWVVSHSDLRLLDTERRAVGSHGTLGEGGEGGAGRCVDSVWLRLERLNSCPCRIPNTVLFPNVVDRVRAVLAGTTIDHLGGQLGKYHTDCELGHLYCTLPALWPICMNVDSILQVQFVGIRPTDYPDASQTICSRLKPFLNTNGWEKCVRVTWIFN